jgi:hypothetical protein
LAKQRANEDGRSRAGGPAQPDRSYPSGRAATPAARGRGLVAALATSLALWFALAPDAARAAPPDEGECPRVSAEPGAGAEGQDAAPLILREGMIIDKQGLMALRGLLPEAVWRKREAFFFEGMRLVIGPCHRRFPIPDFERAATQRFAGQASIDREGNLRSYTAGTPFPQDRIAEDDPLAALKWAWNFEKRFRGAGHRGRFQITSIPNRIGAVERYTGDFFVFRVAGRSDLAETGYRWSGTKKIVWAAGGEFASPFDARGLAWRQLRAPKADERWEDPDDVFVYVPSMRKMRRSGTSWVDGAFVPRYLVAGQSGGGGMMFGSSGSISPTAGQSIAETEDARTGLTGLFLRPNAYVWRLRGEQTVIAPINSISPGYPLSDARNFGPSGLSLAQDRWDVRQAVVIEGALRKADDTIRRVTIYIDHQTLQPLYWITRASRGRLIEVGILVHRFTGDVVEYPGWPGGVPAQVFEPVAASFFDALAGRGGWRRESYALTSLPASEPERQRVTTSDALLRGH